MPLGILSDTEFKAESQLLKTEKGDKLYLYTDGVVDAQNLNGEFFTKDRLLLLLNRNIDSVKVLRLSQQMKAADLLSLSMTSSSSLALSFLPYKA